MNTDANTIEMRGIVKRFPGVLANDQVDFSLRPGEIHALLGENGAGKSTLMNILSGLYQPDEGEIWVKGQRMKFGSPKDAIRCGIGMIHQHFMLVPSHSVAENVILGLDEPRFALNSVKIEAQVAALSEKYRLPVDPKTKIWQLSVGEQQRVEVLKMLYRGAKILIMDEPTAVLTPQEVDELFATLRNMAQDGHSVVFISHKLYEVQEIADRVTVLRRGRLEAGGLDTRDLTKKEMARLMVGREVLFRVEKGESSPGEVLLSVENLEALDDKMLPALRQVSFDIRAGEILGLAGVAGNGQRVLAQTICGLRQATGGQVQVSGQDVTNAEPIDLISQGVAYVPEDRHGVASVPNLSVAENLILRNYWIPPVGKGWMIDRTEMRRQAEELVEQFDVQTPTIDTESRLLSGGNLQKLILAREISGRPRVVIAVHPTRGLDIGATEAVHQILLDQRANGAGVFLISEDLDEILSLADRIAIIYEGQIMDIIDAENADIEIIGLLMAGTQVDASSDKA